MQMSALILRQHFCCASFYFLSWFLFLQILTGFLFKFLLSVVGNFLTLHGPLPFVVFLLFRSLARCAHFCQISKCCHCLLTAPCHVLCRCFSLVFLVFSCFSCPLRRRAVRLIWKQICIIIFARFLWASEFFVAFVFFSAFQFLQKLKLRLFSFCLALALFGCGLLTLPSVWINLITLNAAILITVDLSVTLSCAVGRVRCYVVVNSARGHFGQIKLNELICKYNYNYRNGESTVGMCAWRSVNTLSILLPYEAFRLYSEAFKVQGTSRG